jgi:hypothetical protein
LELGYQQLSSSMELPITDKDLISRQNKHLLCCNMLCTHVMLDVALTPDIISAGVGVNTTQQ